MISNNGVLASLRNVKNSKQSHKPAVLMTHKNEFDPYVESPRDISSEIWKIQFMQFDFDEKNPF